MPFVFLHFGVRGSRQTIMSHNPARVSDDVFRQIHLGFSHCIKPQSHETSFWKKTRLRRVDNQVGAVFEVQQANFFSFGVQVYAIKESGIRVTSCGELI